MDNIRTFQKDTSVLRNSICFMFGRIASELGSSIFKFALSLYILDTTGSATMFSTVLAIGMVPGIFVNIFAGVLIDKSDKKKIIIICDLLSGLIMFLLLSMLMGNLNGIGILILYSMLISTVQSVFSITIYSAIPNFFQKEKVMQMNSSYQGIGAIVNILGPVLGGVFYTVMDFKLLVGIITIVYFLAALVEIGLVYFENEIVSGDSYRKNLNNVFAYIRKEKVIFYLLLIVLAINFVSIPLTSVVLPFLGYKIMMLSSTQYGVVQGVWSLGIIAGALVVSVKAVQSKVTKRIFSLLQVQGIVILFWAAPLLLGKINNSVILGAIIFSAVLLVGGTLNSIINIPLLTYLQISVPENIRASIYGVVVCCITIAAPIGIWLYGFLIEKINIESGIVLSSIIVLLVSTFAVCNKQIKGFFVKDIENL
ncbi:MFS transporter [Kineothrix alysoides]|uniref:MFS transporter n=1 Tax=Kineothrix alysoides TaxID=1469948 RepID=A0A4R1QWB7_9FIRM|nr:MFS transporter [Kineothrix alysoides]TCL57591.1 MFS transporter [Kineothrix alysoides]